MEFRKAKISDIPNLVKTIVEAEKSGTSILTYSTIMELDETQAHELITNVLSIEDLEPCELSLNSFFVAEENGEFAGACSMWLEGEGGVASAQVKSNALMQYLTIDVIRKMMGVRKISQSMQIVQEEGTLQVGVVFVSEAFRGRRLAASLINFTIQNSKSESLKIDKVQVQVFSCNTPAIKAYAKLGFKKKSEIRGMYNAQNYYPCTTKILMELNINKK